MVGIGQLCRAGAQCDVISNAFLPPLSQVVVQWILAVGRKSQRHGDSVEAGIARSPGGIGGSKVVRIPSCQKGAEARDRVGVEAQKTPKRIPKVVVRVFVS